MDLSGWQAIYEELKDQNFEIVAAAQDSAGAKAAAKFYRRAKATYTTLIDTEHRITSLYQMVNVPIGVWIDEEGRIVRPGEVAYTREFRVMGQNIGDKRYVKGLRDWVAMGAKSKYVVPSKKLRDRLSRRGPKERLADVYFSLGTYFHKNGQMKVAQQHWRKAQMLSPNNWNYHRQAWSFRPSDAMFKFLRKVRALGDKPYYEPLDFPDP